MITPEQVKPYAELRLPVETELGRAMLSLRDVLALAPGSVIRLPVPSRSPIRLSVGGAPFATGEVVRVGKSKAVRIHSFHQTGKA